MTPSSVTYNIPSHALIMKGSRDTRVWYVRDTNTPRQNHFEEKLEQACALLGEEIKMLAVHREEITPIQKEKIAESLYALFALHEIVRQRRDAGTS